MSSPEWAMPLRVMQEQAARIAELQADLTRVTAELDETQTQVGDWIVLADEANARAEAAEAKLVERDAESARLLGAQSDQDQKLKDAEDKVARLVGALRLALGIAEKWIRDELDGTSLLSPALAELDPARAALSDIKGAGE